MPTQFKSDTFLKDPTWYKDAIIYQVHVKSYFDSNNDGIGDFTGLIEKLDYIAELGVNTIWVLPFYPSPLRDDGYDIAEYRAVHASYGTLEQVRHFIREAHRRGMRVITELVINHTSDLHPWFERARHAPKGSPERNFYVWSDSVQRYEGTRIIFNDTETSNWTWDTLAGQYYWHRFYAHQPDLNFDNPAVLEEVLSIMAFWFDIGVDGLRLDAIPYLVEREGTSNENLPETHAVLKKIRAYLDNNYPDRMLLAEANLWPEDIQQYFGNGDECHMAFHFPLMPRMYMAIAQEDRYPIIDILRQMPEIPENCQWAIFLRNHDELTLEMVTDHERDYLWEFYAADQRARINLGIRRRLAPLVERDRRRIELLNSLLLSMPGTPTIYYGDEIGMGDNIYLGDRHGVRTPMQWSIDRNGGFSRADPASLVLPTTMDPLYGFQAVNVEAQIHDSHSLLNWTRRMLVIRKQQKAFGRGNLKMLAPANRRILAYLREFTDSDGRHEIILCVANVSSAAQAAELDLSAYAGKVPVEMVGGTSFPPIGQLEYLLTLPPYGFYWFLLAEETQMPGWHVPTFEVLPELQTVIIKQSMLDLLQPPALSTLEQESLPAYLSKRSWFAHGAHSSARFRLHYGVPFGDPHDLYMLTQVEVEVDGALEYYNLPMGFVADQQAGSVPQQLALARMRQGRKAGLLTDAFSLPEFCREVIRKLREQEVMYWQGSEIQFIPTPTLQDLEEILDEEIILISADQTRRTIVIGERMVLKPIRRVIRGIHPDIEITTFLNARGYSNIAEPLGEVRHVNPRGEPSSVMALQAYLGNQGDAWQWTQNTLERALREQQISKDHLSDDQYNALTDLETFAHIMGRRLGEMHLVLAQPTDDPAFTTTISARADSEARARCINGLLREAVAVLGDYTHNLAETHERSGDKNALGLGAANWLLDHEQSLSALVERLARTAEGGLQMRIHGGLTLGQVLVVRGDACFVNFTDDPDNLQRENLRASPRHSPLKDVADLLNSINYSAAIALRSMLNIEVPPVENRVPGLLMETYRQRARAAFYLAYRSAAADLPHEWRERNGEEAALALFGLENALREIIKSRHQPEWLEVPLQELEELAKPWLDSAQ